MRLVAEGRARWLVYCQTPATTKPAHQRPGVQNLTLRFPWLGPLGEALPRGPYRQSPAATNPPQKKGCPDAVADRRARKVERAAWWTASAVSRPRSKRAWENARIHCRVDRSSTDHTLMMTVRAPAVWKARRNPNTPSPTRTTPRPVSQADNTAQSTPVRSTPATSSAVRIPSSSSAPAEDR